MSPAIPAEFRRRLIDSFVMTVGGVRSFFVAYFYSRNSIILNYPHISPLAFSFGPLSVHWYGLMYLFGFFAAWVLLYVRRHQSTPSWTVDSLSDLVFFAAIGLILGGRVGYVLIYAWPEFTHNPTLLFKIWQGGMSFHGGLLGGIGAVFLYAYRHQRSGIAVLDFIVPMVPIGLGAGRLGNFINNELWGRVTDLPWGMMGTSYGLQARHPSQLYEFLLEGVCLFVILWLYTRKPKPLFAPSTLFLVCYGLMRFGVEFFRQPDSQIGFVAFGWMTMGQLLSLPMIAVGAILLVWSYRRIHKE